MTGPRYLQERLAYHVAQGANQYAPMTGVPALREAIADKTAELYGHRPDANSDITVTAGATEALYAAITALVRAGDEVICFDPSYDSYAPAVELSGGVLRRIALQPPHFRVDWQEFAAALSERTRLVILNTPHNPSATVWQREDFAALWQAITDREIYVISDEVYEHICFAPHGHASVLAHPQLRERGGGSLFIWQNLPHDRLESGVLRGAGGNKRRAAQGSSVSDLRGEYARPAGYRRHAAP
ncbi:Methionine aminotransferase [Raoultella planticola]|uniref:Methionine aminotransferase n=1 Tax=Raoultella planticola TaxID=575 RepID=A0A485ATH3_RAOPL|nr:Methionine aminotransferase [Raoultella planticola]